MKLHQYMVLGAALCMGLVACETRESLTENDYTLVEGTGALTLRVDAKEPVSTKAGVSTSNFPVVILNEKGEVVKEYVVKNLPEKVSLEIGKYKVEANSPFELEKVMDYAYYAGNTDFTIINQVVSQAVVTCKRQNCRISLNYDNDFRSTFKSWTITLNDGSESVLSYTYDGTGFASNPADVYWYFEPNTVGKINVHIDAVTKDGQRISDDRAYVKADATQKYDDDNVYFAGGDALDINFTVAVIDMPTEGDLSDIIILDVNLWTESSSESVTIPVEDEVIIPSEPEEGGDNEGTGSDDVQLTFPANANYGSKGTGMPTTADVNIKTPKGLDKMIVKIKGGNDAFDKILIDLTMDGQSFLMSGDGVDVVGNSQFQELLSNFSLSAPQKGVTEYNFPIAVFFTFLNVTGATDAGKAHEFHISVKDKEGNANSGIYKVTIYEE
ncbi:MAG: DUF4493 domain-containing protein [Parabacteroides sp.]|nr:DUF4493 domain-containing protein [Parabacteroides sp.]